MRGVLVAVVLLCAATAVVSVLDECTTHPQAPFLATSLRGTFVRLVFPCLFFLFVLLLLGVAVPPIFSHPAGGFGPRGPIIGLIGPLTCICRLQEAIFLGRACFFFFFFFGVAICDSIFLCLLAFDPQLLSLPSLPLSIAHTGGGST